MHNMYAHRHAHKHADKQAGEGKVRGAGAHQVERVNVRVTERE